MATRPNKIKGTILVIEDTRSWSELLKHTLIKFVTENTITANSMSEAIDIINKNQIDAVVADLCLPDAMSGEIIEYTTKLNIPTWVLTGSFDESVKNTFISKPIVDYIVKNGTYCLEYLCESIKRYWSNKDRWALIVEDTISYQQMYTYILKTQNINVLIANNGKKALSILESNSKKISLVLTDYEMPELNGIEFCQKARLSYRKDNLTIIAISSSTEKVAANFLKAGADDFISKPFSKEELICRINQNIDNIDNIYIIRELINTDFLTGIFNRRHCFTHGHARWDEWLHKQGYATAVMLDIDFFKKINDFYGHDIGDYVIKTLAIKLKEYTEIHDGYAYRFGGEEFALLLPIKLDHAFDTLETLRKEIEETTLFKEEKTIKFTVSIGIFSTSTNYTKIENCLKHADENLYTAKSSGRNVIIYTSSY